MAENESLPSEKEILLLAAETGKAEALDLHGYRIEDAKNEVDIFLNRQFMAGARFVKIVHGKGTGALSRALSEYVSAHPLVEYSRESSAPGQEGAAIAAVLIEKE